MLDLDLWKLALFLMLGVAPVSAARAASDGGPARTGRVVTSLPRSSTLHVPDIETCVVETFRKMEFPKPSADKVTIWYGVMFTPRP